ncbi:MAG TPA: GldG family protein [Actinomycetota bacterium]|nr:GldG family protein [Actinomycetota bacterium]
MTPRRAFVWMAAFVVVVLAVNVGIGRAHIGWDLTAEGSASLSSETRRVLRDVSRRIEITAFFPREAPGRVEAATLLSRYRRANRRITFRVLDPQLAPGEAQRLGVSEIGSAAVQDVADPKRIETAQYTIEIDITSALARLVRGVDATVCFAAGHGEREPEASEGTGYSRAAALLTSNGYRTRTVNLLAGRGIGRCDAVIFAAPTTRPATSVVRTIRSYLAGGGKLFALADPDANTNLTPLTEPWGIRFERGVILEGDSASHLPTDVTTPIVSRYAGGSAPVRGLGPTFFPGAMGVDTRDTGNPGLTVTGIAFTSPLGYLDRADVTEFDPKVDREGPIAIGAAADDSEVKRPGTARASIRRTRILAFGDVDFASNAYISDAANARLWVQGIDWLTQPEDLVTAVPSFPKIRELNLTAARSRYLLLVTAGLLPGLFLIAGGFVWALRRGR